MKKKSKLLKIALFVVIASISVNIFCFPAYAQEEKTVESNTVLKYNGTVDDDLAMKIYKDFKLYKID